MCALNKSHLFLKANTFSVNVMLEYSYSLHWCVCVCMCAYMEACVGVFCGFLSVPRRVCESKVDEGHFDLQKSTYLETGARQH